LSTSFPFTITHDPLGHWTVPGAQVIPQAPLLQTSPGWQRLPHIPQLVASDDTQAPLQVKTPGWH
jgi:hypothetical protein